MSAAAPAQGPSREAVLDLFDRALGEPARRDHRFSWLRGPETQWIPVDAYYPSQRLVVQCVPGADGNGDAGAEEELRAREVPLHGLRYLAVDPAELDGDEGRDTYIADLLAALAPPELPRHLQPPGPSRATRMRDALQPRLAQLAPHEAANAGQPVPDPPPVNPFRQEAYAELQVMRLRAQANRRHAPARRERDDGPAGARAMGPRSAAAPASTSAVKPTALQAVGFLLGLAAVALALLELYLAVKQASRGASGALIAVGLAFDVFARGLGAYSAGNAGEHLWAAACALIGSPAVALRAAAHRAADDPTQSAIRAGLVASIALVTLLAALGLRGLGG